MAAAPDSLFASIRLFFDSSLPRRDRLTFAGVSEKESVLFESCAAVRLGGEASERDAESLQLGEHPSGHGDGCRSGLCLAADFVLQKRCPAGSRVEIVCPSAPFVSRHDGLHHGASGRARTAGAWHHFDVCMFIVSLLFPFLPVVFVDGICEESHSWRRCSP